ncbi:MAG: EAL domain-containing protein [Pseudomonadota bacterium]|nr:EAL domain-containing protein [Pseudomonadota bacterium]
MERWLPFLVLVAVSTFGLFALLMPGPHTLPEPAHADYRSQPAPERTLGDLQVVLAPLNQAIPMPTNSEQWQPVSRERPGIGYPGTAATFRISVTNPAQTPATVLMVIDAPYLDHIAPVIVHPTGGEEFLRVMGDRYPFPHEHLGLPQWIWPVTLMPGESTLFIEVQNRGPITLPLAIDAPVDVISDSAFSTAWKSLISGLLIFALLLNLSLLVRHPRPGIAWLTVLMLSVVYSQLVMDGLGYWLFWSEWPELNTLLSVSLPLCLIALCQFTPHVIPVSRNASWVLHGFSVAAVVHTLAAPFSVPFLGQDLFLVLATAGGAFIVSLVFRQIRRHAYARYFALSVLAMLLGGVVTALRTTGWLPVNLLTDSAFFLGAAVGSLILTGGFARILIHNPHWRLETEGLMRDLRPALISGQMWLEYQTKVRISDGQPCSVEALIRWHHPRHGLLAPDQWIPLAEQAGLIHSVTLWVLEQACLDAAQRRSHYGLDLPVGVNISARDLAHSRFPERVMAIAGRHGVPPGQIILEITETAMMTNPDRSRAGLSELKALGFRIALDDFGAGHSSLGTLAQLPLHELKLDRSLSQNVLSDATRQSVLTATLELGAALGLTVVVEGVEDEALARWLNQFPGLQGQGYFWSRPERIRSATDLHQGQGQPQPVS